MNTTYNLAGNLQSEAISSLNLANLLPFNGAREKVDLYLETANYILTEPSTFDELIDIFKFRFSIFGVSAVDDVHLDFDSFDRYCDHLIVKDKKNHDIVGVYRFISSTKNKKFYSSSEFSLGGLLKLSGNKLELGRASVSPMHRNGQVIDLLWKGIGLMAKKYNSRYLFGCSSLMSTEASDAQSLYYRLKNENYIDNEINVFPVDKYAFTFKPHSIQDDNFDVPPLLKSYLMAGAKIAGLPAFDEEFGCFDFLTILDLNNISPSFKRRYF